MKRSFILNLFKVLTSFYWRNHYASQRQASKNNTKSNDIFKNSVPGDGDFQYITNSAYQCDYYLYNAWVNIAIHILIRNLARADFIIEKNAEELKNGLLFDLFHWPNPHLSRYDLWKETAAWWHLEVEAFWWFGPDYSGGVPRELYILNPRRLRFEITGGGVYDELMNRGRRWFYQYGHETITIFSDELISVPMDEAAHEE